MKIMAICVVLGTWFAFGETVSAPEHELAPSAYGTGAPAKDWDDSDGTRSGNERIGLAARAAGRASNKDRQGAAACSWAETVEANGSLSHILRNMISKDWDCWRQSFGGGLLLSSPGFLRWEGSDRGRDVLSLAAPAVDESVGRAGQPNDERSNPVATAVDAHRSPSHARPSAAYDGFLTQLWTWRKTLISLPALCGLALLCGHLLLRAVRSWWRRQRRADDRAGHLGLADDREAPSPFIASIVEREHRRAIERARVLEERQAALAGKKKDMSRAA